MHLNLDNAVSGARLAASPLDIKAESSLLIPPRLRVRRRCEQIPDHIENPAVGGRV